MLERDFRTDPGSPVHRSLCWWRRRPAWPAGSSFECSPRHEFLGLPVNGRKVSFTENVFYEFLGGRIRKVWSVIDKAAIEAQL